MKGYVGAARAVHFPYRAYMSSFLARQGRKGRLSLLVSSSLLGTPGPGSITPEVTENHDFASSQQQQTDNLCYSNTV